MIRVAFRSIALANGPSTIAAILRGIFGRLSFKSCKVFSSRKAELSAIICRLETFRAFNRLAFSEVSDRVVALDSDV